jgi:high-affinity K+ transport system ATPase subunit B
MPAWEVDMEITWISIGRSDLELAQAAVLSSMSDQSDEGNAIFSKSLEIAKNFSIPRGSNLIVPSGPDSLSGVDLKTQKIRKGSCLRIGEWLHQGGHSLSEDTQRIVSEVEKRGHQAVVIADQEHELGVLELA